MAQLKYEYDPKLLAITESEDGTDREFRIRCLTDIEHSLKQLKRIRGWFEENPVVTDALFYYHGNGDVQVIVREDFYAEFVLALMRCRLLQRVWWEE